MQTYTYIYTHTYTYIYTYVYKYIYTYIYAYIYTYKYMHKYVYYYKQFVYLLIKIKTRESNDSWRGEGVQSNYQLVMSNQELKKLGKAESYDRGNPV